MFNTSFHCHFVISERIRQVSFHLRSSKMSNFLSFHREGPHQAAQFFYKNSSSERKHSRFPFSFFFAIIIKIAIPFQKRDDYMDNICFVIMPFALALMISMKKYMFQRSSRRVYPPYARMKSTTISRSYGISPNPSTTPRSSWQMSQGETQTSTMNWASLTR